MALVPNTWDKSTFDPGPDQVDWTEGLGPVSVEIGFSTLSENSACGADLPAGRPVRRYNPVCARTVCNVGCTGA